MTPSFLTSNDNRDNGALVSLDISNNKLIRGKRKDEYKSRTGDEDYYYESDMSGVIALAEAIKK